MIAVDQFDNRLKNQENDHFEQHKNVAVNKICKSMQEKKRIRLLFKTRHYREMLKFWKFFKKTKVKFFFELKNYIDVFNESEIKELSSHRNFLNHFVDFLLRKNSFFESIYNLFENELTVLKAYIDKNLVNKFIVRFKFSADTSILSIKKSDEKLRLCVNYRDFNVISIKNKYFISLIINIVNR